MKNTPDPRPSMARERWSPPTPAHARRRVCFGVTRPSAYPPTAPTAMKGAARSAQPQRDAVQDELGRTSVSGQEVSGVDGRSTRRGTRDWVIDACGMRSGSAEHLPCIRQPRGSGRQPDGSDPSLVCPRISGTCKVAHPATVAFPVGCRFVHCNPVPPAPPAGCHCLSPALPDAQREATLGRRYSRPFHAPIPDPESAGACRSLQWGSDLWLLLFIWCPTCIPSSVGESPESSTPPPSPSHTPSPLLPLPLPPSLLLHNPPPSPFPVCPSLSYLPPLPVVPLFLPFLPAVALEGTAEGSEAAGAAGAAEAAGEAEAAGTTAVVAVAGPGGWWNGKRRCATG